MKRFYILLCFFVSTCYVFAQSFYTKDEVRLFFTQFEKDLSFWENSAEKVPCNIVPQPDGEGIMVMMNVQIEGKYLCVSLSKRSDLVLYTENCCYPTNSLYEYWWIQKMNTNTDLDLDAVYFFGNTLYIVCGENFYNSNQRDVLALEVTTPSSIQNKTVDRNFNDAIFNVSGIRMKSPLRNSLYIQNGKKILNRD